LDSDELVIIGAGPAGLALSSSYAGRSRILEKTNEVGGLCRSIEFGGGVFDIGGHSFHSPHPEVLGLIERLMTGRWHRQRRDARVFFNGDLIDYPFQRHFEQISDAAIVAECRRHRPATDAVAAADNFEDWIVERFGLGVAHHFMLPYNRKLWARDLRRMSCEWVQERIAESGPDHAPQRERTRRPLEAESQVAYPADGGFVEIFRALARHCGPIEFGREVCDIDPKAKAIRTADGGVRAWDRLVSTMPLPALLRAIHDCPKDLVDDADRLEFVSLKMLLILVGKAVANEPQRVYVADPHVPTHKIAFNHTSSPSLRLRPVQAIMCEISRSLEKPLAADADLEQTILEWLVEARLIRSRGDVAETRFVDVDYGYPVYTHDRPAILKRIGAYLARLDIFTIGRFGAWEYVNSDACIRQGIRLAAQLG
jgi:protoporphyrinogen oxidase